MPAVIIMALQENIQVTDSEIISDEGGGCHDKQTEGKRKPDDFLFPVLDGIQQRKNTEQYGMVGKNGHDDAAQDTKLRQ